MYSDNVLLSQDGILQNLIFFHMNRSDFKHGWDMFFFEIHGVFFEIFPIHERNF